jgi:hypothetical protein
MTGSTRLRPGQWVRHRPNANKGYEVGKVLRIDDDGLAAVRFYRAIRWFFSDIDDFAAHEWPDDDMSTPFEQRRLWYLMNLEACHGRELCPCCAYPTLLPVREEVNEELHVAVSLEAPNCPLCLWFDRGIDDQNADDFDVVNEMTLAEGRGNFALRQSSLGAEANSNFARALHDPAVCEVRDEAIRCFERLRSESGTHARQSIWTRIEYCLIEAATRREKAEDRLNLEFQP